MSKHVTIEELLKRIADNTAAIQKASASRVCDGGAVCTHTGVVQTNLNTDEIRSQRYVPGVFGWKLDKKTGDGEINSCTLGSVGSAPERQMVSVEVASYSKYDLPKNAANLLQFMEAELQKVPEEFRHAAEFEEFDTSYGDESFNPRLFLSYSRLETEEELAARLEKAKMAGTRIVKEGGCTTIICDGVVRVRYGNLAESEHPQPFKVKGDQVFISEADIQDGTISNARIAATPGDALKAGGCSALLDKWSVRMELRDGKYVAAGIGLGVDSQFLVSADQFAIKEPTEIDKAHAAGDVTRVLELLAAKIDKTELSSELKDQIDRIGSTLADTVRDVIRAEMKPGGLLHRSN